MIEPSTGCAFQFCPIEIQRNTSPKAANTEHTAPSIKRKYVSPVTLYRVATINKSRNEALPTASTSFTILINGYPRLTTAVMIEPALEDISIAK